jgi:hypothetical protein
VRRRDFRGGSRTAVTVSARGRMTGTHAHGGLEANDWDITQ